MCLCLMLLGCNCTSFWLLVKSAVVVTGWCVYIEVVLPRYASMLARTLRP